MGRPAQAAVMSAATSLILLAVSLSGSQVAGYPGALCNVTYEIPSPCGEVFSLLTQQMQEWDNSTACRGGQKCLYVHTETSDQFVKGSHITPVIRYVDDIIFEKLEEDENVCTVHGYSFSTGPAYYDYTTNYCNMRNLMVGAGLAGLEGYREESSVDLCMQ